MVCGMLRVSRTGVLRALLSRRPSIASAFSTTSTTFEEEPNAPLRLDSSLDALLRDVDMSLIRHKTHASVRPPPRELHALPLEGDLEAEPTIYDAEDTSEQRLQRKSPAAHFGSQSIGTAIIPLQLQKAISLLIAASDRSQLRNDAKRLFLDNSEDIGEAWDTAYDTKYRSYQQTARHAERDGTAFASIALPAHYSAITSVLDHIKRRLGPEWNVERVIDWGTGTGSGIWASLHAFQKDSSITEVEDLQIANSTVVTCLGIDKRVGLVAIGKRLFGNVPKGLTSLTWQKTFQEDDKISRFNGRHTLALSAFMLSSLPTPLARKALVKEMWESGAHVMVLIDHSTPAGFGYIAEAREYLLSVGRKELEDPGTADWDIRGSHAVAPCPHDGECPLYRRGSNKAICGFSQRLQRPAFVRKTKHSGVGHEDVGYSYVVIRRGPRPPAGDTKVGRIGAVGKEAVDKAALANVPLKELRLHSDHAEHDTSEDYQEPIAAPDVIVDIMPSSQEELNEALRLEAFHWPRLVFPPLKRSGHIILDSCTPEGKIMRLTIPKSQGKQPYYDARKSQWGDIFPHAPKNAPQERYNSSHTSDDQDTSTARSNIGKRKSKGPKERASYEGLSKKLKESRTNVKMARSIKYNNSEL